MYYVCCFLKLISKSGQGLKSLLPISLSLGAILNSTSDAGRTVNLTSCREQFIEKIKFSNLNAP